MRGINYLKRNDGRVINLGGKTSVDVEPGVSAIENIENILTHLSGFENFCIDFRTSSYCLHQVVEVMVNPQMTFLKKTRPL